MRRTPEEEAEGTRKHREKYGRLVALLGADRLRPLLPPVRRPWSELIAGDVHLNNVPLAEWDARDPGVRSILRHSPAAYEAIGRGGWSLSDSVCVLKELARQIAEQPA